jgi:carbohydrate-selective porin OprB
LGDLQGLQVHVSGSWASGEDLSADDIGNIFTVSQIFSGDTVRVAALLLDQMVYREGPPGSHQGLTPLMAFTFAPSDRNTLPFYFYAGLVYHGLFPGRDSDVTAFGLAYGKFSDDLAGQDFETVLEWTHEFVITPWLSVQPDVQYIIKPSGMCTIPNALVLGVALAINF